MMRSNINKVEKNVRYQVSSFEESWESAWKRPLYHSMLPSIFCKEMKAARKKGEQAIFFRLDRATRHGQDAAALEKEDIHEGGLSLSTLQDFQTAFQSMDLNKFSLYCCTGAENAAFLGALSAYQRSNGENVRALKGILAADPLGVLAEEGTLPIGLAELYDELAQTVLWGDKNMEYVDTVLVSSLPYAEGGASITQEIACVIETGKEYLKALVKRGVSIETAARHLSFWLCVSDSYDLDRWKYKVVSCLWEEVLQELGLMKSSMMKLYFVRSEYQHLAHDPYFFASTLQKYPSEWYQKSLLENLMDNAKEIMRSIESVGGISKALEQGLLQRAIHKTKEYRLKEVLCQLDLAKNMRIYVTTKERMPKCRISDTEIVRNKRLLDIAEYQSDLDEHKKTLALARVTLTLLKPDLGLVEMLEEAFLSGASIGDTIIALHIGQDDFYIGKAISKSYLVEYLRLRRVKK